MTKRINKVHCIPAITLALLLASSCSKNVIYTDSASIPGKIWSIDNIPEFSFNVSDTLSAADVSFSIRTGSDYPYRNIFLFVTASSPDGKTISDTLEYDLADEKGNWYGKGPGDIHELTLPYKTNVFFPVNGVYIFKIQHGMRIRELAGVYDLGIRIVKTSR